MAARTSLLFRACVIYAMAVVSTMSMCPKECFCAGFLTDCEKSGLTNFPSESEIEKDIYRLYLNDNKLDNVARIDLPNLEKYRLQGNEIRNIEEDAFLGLPKLKTLNLSRNLISDLQKEEFQPLSKLEDLDLSFNKLTKIGELIFNATFLQKLDFSHNEIETIDRNSFTTLKSLVTLRLNNNKLKSIQHNHFNGVVNLLHLYLHCNQLQTIEDKSFYPMDGLVTLTLNKNVLKKVPVEALDDLLVLKTLNIGGNLFSKLTKTDFPYTHGYLVNLVLSNMPNLQNIEEKAFDNLPNLKNVNISNNPKLTSLPAMLFYRSFHKLRNVDLSNNSLSEIDKEMLPWDMLNTLSVTGNKWRCDCTCRWMKNYTFERDLQCASPKRLTGRMMDDIPEYEFFCAEDHGDNQRALRMSLSAGALTLSLFIILAILFKTRRRMPCFKGEINYTSLYNIYDPHKDINSGIVVTFRGDKVETKSTGVDLEKDML